MALTLDDTIVAVSSGVAPAKRGIVRISGPNTHAILDQLLQPTCSEQTQRKARLLKCTRARCEEVACETGMGRSLNVWCYYWPDGRSFTGETCAEIHLLGSLPIIERLTEHICALGARPADRGEFTLRSFMSGKIDLTQAEAVLGVIEADSEQDLHDALSQLGGNLSQPVRELRNRLLVLTADVEAALDFVEEDIQFISVESLRDQLESTQSHLRSIADQLVSRGSRKRTAQIMLVGLPNAGKSSLFNALINRKRVIVSPTAGTTRDMISHPLSLEGHTVDLVDTAGIETWADQSPRSMAQDALHSRLLDADLVVVCSDASSPPDESAIRILTDAGISPSCMMTIETKCDLANAASGDASIRTSVHDPQSLDSLRRSLARRLSEHAKSLKSDALHRTMIRCSARITSAIEAIDRSLALVGDPYGDELVAAELRLAIDDLSSIIGEVHTEDILGEIFSRFCIGK